MLSIFLRRGLLCCVYLRPTGKGLSGENKYPSPEFRRAYCSNLSGVLLLSVNLIYVHEVDFNLYEFELGIQVSSFVFNLFTAFSPNLPTHVSLNRRRLSILTSLGTVMQKKTISNDNKIAVLNYFYRK